MEEWSPRESQPLRYSPEEMQDLLRWWGYTLKKEKKTFWESGYQGLTFSSYVAEVDVLYDKKGEKVVGTAKGTGDPDNYIKLQQEVFFTELKARLLKSVLR